MAKRSTKKADTKSDKATYAAGKHTVLPDANDNVIVHLNVPTIPDEATAYNAIGNYAFLDETESASAIDEPPAFDARYNVILEEFAKKTEANDWPAQTNVCCHWCCHPFSNAPVSLPFAMVHGETSKYKVNGCFCSFQCAAAYNFEHTNDVDGMWEKYALLNCLYHDTTQGGTRLIPAPARQTLKMFGGYLTIDEFRNKCIGTPNVSSGTFVDIMRSPMVFVPPQVDEINEANIAHPLKFIPVDEDRMNKVREKFQLKRTKPLVDSKHTLDHIMGLRVTSDDSAT